jgi:hypothetical protein
MALKTRKLLIPFAALGLWLPAHALAADGGSVGPDAGDREFILGGSGSSNNDLENTTLNLGGELGWYWTDHFELGIRQSVNYADIESEGIEDDYWNGATRGFFNYHFGNGFVRPFIGASLGGIYGDGIDNRGFAGPELGAKVYVLSKTFLYARGEYQFFFEDADNADERFDEGAWAYGLGVGYNF